MSVINEEWHPPKNRLAQTRACIENTQNTLLNCGEEPSLVIGVPQALIAAIIATNAAHIYAYKCGSEYCRKYLRGICRYFFFGCIQISKAATHDPRFMFCVGGFIL